MYCIYEILYPAFICRLVCLVKVFAFNITNLLALCLTFNSRSSEVIFVERKWGPVNRNREAGTEQRLVFVKRRQFIRG